MVSDVTMPDVDGYELIEQVRRLPPEQGGCTPAIALTGRDDDRQRAVAAGFEMHVTKPVEPGSLVAAVARLAADPDYRVPRNGIAHLA
jgi:CheY-like chemotaxis protein